MKSELVKCLEKFTEKHSMPMAENSMSHILNFKEIFHIPSLYVTELWSSKNYKIGKINILTALKYILCFHILFISLWLFLQVGTTKTEK